MAPAGQLLRILGVSFGLAVTVGGMIGAGILRTPGAVAGQLETPLLLLLVWLLGGVYALVGCFAIIELGTALPQAGGWYVFARRAFGAYGGFVIGWGDWIGTAASLAYMSIAVTDVLETLVPGLVVWKTGIAIALLLGFGLLHSNGLKLGSRTQEVTSLLKALGFLGLILCCFWIGQGAGWASEPRTGTSTFAWAGVVLALQSVIVTYDGWYAAAYFTEEDQNPSQNLPRSMLGGVGATMAIYLLFNAALLEVLSLDQLATAKVPAVAAAEVIFGPIGKLLIALLSLVTLLSILNATSLIGPRVLFAMGRDGLFFAQVTQVSKSGTPMPALILTTLIAMGLTITGTFEQLVAVSAFVYAVIYLSGFTALIVLRQREPNLIRPFRCWGYPWTPLLVITGSLLFLGGMLWNDLVNSLYGCLLLALSYPVYRFCRVPKV